MNELKISNIRSGYEDGPDIVKGISFTLTEGSFTCILGPNGCGKSTLLKSVLGFMPVREGEVSYNQSIDVLHLKEEERAKILAYIPQAHNPPFPFLVRDVVRMGRTPYLNRLSKETEEDHAIAQHAMEITNILDLQEFPYNLLSGGQRQLVMIARAIAQGTSFLIMDEPTNNLDYGNQYRVLSAISSLSKSMNLSVLMVTHDPHHCFFIADHVILINQGKIVEEGRPEEIIHSDSLTGLYSYPIKVADIDFGNTISRACIPQRMEM
ncbi:MAG: ABC transporter ATP-binding protein [Coriobacteriia bacterium]|nr:ABC transporter ATP-binding protein [Coriobacteriia bacterium]